MASKKLSVADLETILATALTPILQRAGGAVETLAIAYSGGLDSSALLHLLHRYAQKNNIKLHAFHIHHGLSPHADDWLMHCAAVCTALEIPFSAQRVQLKNIESDGIEAAARSSRYAALGALCRAHQIGLLLTAHHQDDQAETVLLQLLRGSGVAGLSGMESANHARELLGDAALLMARPLLGVSRRQLADFVAASSIRYLDDESNQDMRYARNALRHQVMPALLEAFPGFQQRLARTASHAQSAQRLLVELAAQDNAHCADGSGLVISRLRTLSSERIDNLLRYWFAVHRVRMPSTAWLSELRHQLFDAKADAQLCVTHADCLLRRHRDRVYITPRLPEIDPDDKPLIAFDWREQAQLEFDGFGGRLLFESADIGFSASWLAQQTFTIGLRRGGERVKLAANRPTRALKYHYQAADVPAWERERLPIVYLNKSVLFAAGIGMDCHHFSTIDEPRIALRWEFDCSSADSLSTISA